MNSIIPIVAVAGLAAFFLIESEESDESDFASPPTEELILIPTSRTLGPGRSKGKPSKGKPSKRSKSKSKRTRRNSNAKTA
jgi:hypothetical protein